MIPHCRYLKLSFLLLCRIVESNLVVESRWGNSYRCEGPPNSLVVFNVNDISAFGPDEGEIWPVTYESMASANPLGVCGNLYVPTYTQCCVSSLNLEVTGNFQSSLPALIEDESNFDSLIHKDANGLSYCDIQPVDAVITPTLFNHMLFLTDNSCIDGVYRCFKNGTFAIYSEKQCSGIVEVYPLDSSSTIQSSSIIGTFEGKTRIIANAANSRIWIMYNPLAETIPNTMAISDVLTHVTHILYFPCLLAVCWTYFSKFIAQKNRMYLFLGLLNSFRILLRILHIFYWYTPIRDWNTSVYFATVYYSIYGLEGIFTVLLTGNQIIRMKLFKLSKLFQIICTIAIIAIHLVLYGGYYFYFCAAATDYEPIIPLYSLTIFIFVFNLTPVIGLPYFVSRKVRAEESIFNVFKFFVTLDAQFNITLVVHLILIIVFVVLSSMNQTTVFGDDRVSYFFGHVRRTIVGFHELLTTISLDRLQSLMKKIALSSIVKSEKSGMQSVKKSVEEY
ncbi:hypothetical protein HDV02_006522 [Globomyces sp. JEL0801]|nr:hypothetical protein HDV02_006522 [Globomyces sp. JEL0801]